MCFAKVYYLLPHKVRSNQKRCVTVTSQRAHNLISTQIARVQCPAARPPVTTLPSFATLDMSLLLALTILPPLFPHDSKHCTTNQQSTLHSHS